MLKLNRDRGRLLPDGSCLKTPWPEREFYKAAVLSIGVILSSNNLQCVVHGNQLLYFRQLLKVENEHSPF